MTLSTFFECMLTSLNPPSICKKMCTGPQRGRLLRDSDRPNA